MGVVGRHSAGKQPKTDENGDETGENGRPNKEYGPAVLSRHDSGNHP